MSRGTLMAERESNWANASKPDPRELAQWVATIRLLIVDYYEHTGRFLTVAEIIAKLASGRD
jgi:hypothetical protein